MTHGFSRPAPRAIRHPSTGRTAPPAIGRDEWVARHADRRLPAWPARRDEARLAGVPWWAWLALFSRCRALFPVFSSSGYVRRVGFDTVLYMLLALGLNVVVGWGGLLDLGYIAFYGVGAYAYALLASDHYGIHMWSIASIPIVVVRGGVVGFLVGLPSRRLSGDYLAIVTLFFLQLFHTIATNGDQFFFGAGNVTGGANGILRVDPLDFFGHDLAARAPGPSTTTSTSRSASSRSSSSRSRSSTSRGPAAPGGRCARTRSPPR